MVDVNIFDMLDAFTSRELESLYDELIQVSNLNFQSSYSIFFLIY